MRNKTCLLAFVVALLAISGTCSALETLTNCTDGVLNTSIPIKYEGVTYIINQSVTCELGCAANGLECASPLEVPAELYVGVVLGLGLFAGIFAFVSFKIREEDWPISMLFLFCTLLMALICISLLMGFNIQTQDQVADLMINGFNLMLATIILFIVYFFIKIIAAAINMMWRGASTEE